MTGNATVSIPSTTGATLRSLMTPERWIEVVRIVATGIVALLFWRGLVPVALLWVAVAVGLYPLVKVGLLDLLRERKIGTEIFVTIATLVALFGGEPVAGAVLMVIILIAEFIAELNTDRARASIQALIGSVPRHALLRSPQGERRVSIDELQIGDVVLVRTGEKVPVDGKVVAGQGAVDEAPITGESLPQDKSVGSTVFAGTIVGSGALDIRTERLGKDTTFSRIIALVETAESEQAPIQKLADKVAAWLIPVVLVFLVAVFVVTRDVRMAVTLLIFTSPAELGLATPLVMIAAIARAARAGILIKGGVYLEALAKADAVLFDKTGTLTANQPKVVEVLPLAPAFDAAAILRFAAIADRRSAHPLAQAIVEAAVARNLELPEPADFAEVQGRGIKAAVEGRSVLVGNAALLRDQGVAVDWSAPADGRTPIHVAIDGALVGAVFVADVVRPGARQLIDDLRRSGVRRIVMLTGDNQATATAVARELGITEVRADLLPEDKLKEVAKISTEGFRVAFVGDGVNDAPALARSDVGIAMGAGGSQAALEAANIALMTDDLSRITAARAIARRAYRTIQENLFVGVGVVHVLGITAALLGLIGPIEAAIIHLGPDVLVFLNSVKLLRVRIDGA